MEQAISVSENEMMVRLAEEHRVLKQRIRRLDRRVSLTSAEQVERAQLKKMKVATKDRMRALVG